jgi:hypothetical protein
MEIEEGGQKTSTEVAAPAPAQTGPLPFHLIRISPQRDLILLVSGSRFSIFNLK